MGTPDHESKCACPFSDIDVSKEIKIQFHAEKKTVMAHVRHTEDKSHLAIMRDKLQGRIATQNNNIISEG